MENTTGAAEGKQPVKRTTSEHSHKIICLRCRDPHPNLIEDFAAGDLICQSCGFVVGDRIIDTRSEWRTFSNDGTGGDDPSRVGGPSNPLLDGDQLDTMISGRDNYSGASKDLNRLQSRTNYKSIDRTLIQSYKEISTLCERVGLPKVITDRAKQLYKLADEAKVLKGKGNDGIVATCVYVACRQAKVTRTFKEISALTRVPKRDIGRCYKLLAPLLDTKMATVSTEDFITRFCSYLSLPIEVQRAAVYLAQKCTETGCTAGKSPISIASAGIYLISHLFPNTKKTPKEVSFVSGVSEATIRGTYRDLLAFKLELVPRELHHMMAHLPPA
jgi:transcription initiation factor TFIIB